MNTEMNLDRKIKYVCIVDSVLLVILVAGLLCAPGNRARRGTMKNLITLDSITHITLSGGTSMEILKQGETWQYIRNGAELPVNAGRVDAFIKSIQKPAKITPVGRTQDALQTYKLTEQERIVVELANNNNKQSFYLSPLMDSADTCYVMFNGNNTVYKAETSSASFLLGMTRDWLDLKLLSNVSVKDVQRFTIKGKLTKENIEGAFARSTNGWIYENNTEFATARVEGWLYSMVSATADDYLETLTLSNQNETVLISLELGNGTTKHIRIYEVENSKNYIVYSSDKLYPMQCSLYQLENILKTADELK